MKRVAVASMFHETNTFAMAQNSALDADLRIGQDILTRAHPRNFEGGFVHGFVEAATRPDIELVMTVGVRFRHGGLIHARVFEHYVGLIVDAIADAGPLDAVYFALHGAMAAEDPYTDAEGELLARVRAVVGEGVPFVATYDFHNIMSHAECAQLAAAFPNDTNPHVDSYDRGQEAGTCMLRILDGEINPVTRVVHIPIIGPNIGQSTWSHIPEQEERLPMYQLNLVREALEQTPGIINISIQGGYGYADTPESRMSVVVTADGDVEKAVELAQNLAEQVWAKRQEFLDVRPIVSIDEGVRQAMASNEDKPIVLVDLGDDPGSSCAADSPAVLESLIRLGASDVALVMRDAAAVEAAMQAGIGARLELDVGASLDQRFYEPLRISGTVRLLDDGKYMVCGPIHGGWGKEVTRDAWQELDAGPRAVVRLANRVDVIFYAAEGPFSHNRVGKDRDFFKSAGIIFDEKKILVVKSNQAHRASFDTVVAGNIDLASPGGSTVDYAMLPYRHAKRPLWPIDREFVWSAADS